jgi:WD40 repeat protein
MTRLTGKSVAAMSLAVFLMAACNRNPTPEPRLEPTRTLAPQPTAAPATATPAITAATAPAPQALTGLTLESVDQLKPVFSLRQPVPRSIYSVSADRIAMFGAREFIIANPRTLQIESRTPITLSSASTQQFWYALSADGTTGAIMQLDGAIDVYDFTTSRIITGLLVPAPSGDIASDLALNADASEAIVISRAALRRINLKEGGLIGEGQALPPASVFVRFSEDAARAAAVQPTGEIVVINALSGAPAITLTNELSGAVATVNFSPNGQKLAVATNGELVVWDLSGSEPKVQRAFKDLQTVVEPVFDRSGKYMAAIAGPGAYMFDLQTDQGLGEFRLPGNVPVWSAGFDPKSETFFLIGSGQIASFSLPNGDPIDATLQIPLTRASFSPDGRTVTTWSTTFASGDAAVLNMSDGAPASRLPHDAPIRWLIHSPSGRYIASLTLANSVHLWNAASGESLAEVTVPTSDTVRALLCFATDDSRVFYLDGNAVKAEPVMQNVPVGTVDLPFKPVALSTCSNDKRWLAVADADTVEVMQLDGKRVSRVEMPADLGEIGALYVSRNGERLGVIGKTMALVYDTGTGKELQKVRVSREPLAGAFSDDGSRLALNYGDGVDVIDTASGKSITLDLPKGSLVTLLFPRDARILVTAAQIASADTADKPLAQRQFVTGELSVWDVQSAGTLLRKIEMKDPIFTASMSEDGAHLALNFADNAMMVWGVE